MSASQMLQKEASGFSTPDRSRFKKKFSPRSLVFDSSAEISKQNLNVDDITNGFTASPSDPDLSASPEISLHSELTQSSEVKPGLVSAAVGDSTSFNSLEAEIAVGLLRKAMAQVLKSPNAVDSQSRKLLEHLIQVVIEMHQKDPDETDRIGKLLQAKTRIVLVFVLLCSFATVVTWIFRSKLQGSFGKPPPT
ncbi:hypothetical protein L484_027114 [Morus notabilis]|uniref:Uncharacterized protein n=1 Tax=Morus notabilis TaxID=981085 RepID=W9S119_9ROSA|nr:hypothetical protein L484_027114 [Morus notabilis]